MEVLFRVGRPSRFHLQRWPMPSLRDRGEVSMALQPGYEHLIVILMSPVSHLESVFYHTLCRSYHRPFQTHVCTSYIQHKTSLSFTQLLQE